jgi:steroid delta-isomerase-like uncharacterized protein
MTQDENRRVFNEWIEAHRAHDIDRMLTFLTDDITIQSAAGGKMPPAKSKEEARLHWGAIFETFPDMRMEPVDTTSEGDRILAEISHGGTMRGRMGDVEPTGKSYRVTGAFRLEFREGKIKSILSYWDTAAMLGQLGLIPDQD